MAKKDIYIAEWYDGNGKVYATGRRSNRYFIERVALAYTPRAGEVTREYVSKQEAENFDPDPSGEVLTYRRY